MFKKIIVWLLCITLAIPGVGSILYFTVPQVKNYVNEKILKVEQISEDKTEDTNDETVSSLQEQIEANKTIIANLNTELSKQRTEVTKLKNEAKASQETIDALQTSINTKQSELDAAVAEKNVLEEQKTEIQAEIQAKQAELETLKSEANANAETIANLEADIQAKQTELATLQTEAEEDAKTIAELQSDLQTKQAELAQMQANANADAETIAGLESDIAAIQSELDTLEIKVNEDATTIANLQTEVSAKQTTIDELEANAEEDAATIERLSDEKSQYQQFYYNAQEDINRLDAQIIELDADINALEEERDSLLVTISEKNAEIETLQGNITTLEDEVSAKEVEITSLNEEILILQNALNKDESKTYISDLLLEVDKAESYLKFVNVSEHEYLAYPIASQASGFSGIYLFNDLDGSVEKLHATGYEFISSYLKIDDVAVIIGCKYQDEGYFIYNIKAKELTKPIDVGYGIDTASVYNLDSKGLLFNSGGASYNGGCGVLYFDINSFELSVVYDTIGYWLTNRAVCEISGGNILFSSGQSTGSMCLFNPETKETIVVDSSISGSDFFALSNGNAAIIDAKSSSKSYYYDSTNNNITMMADIPYCTSFAEVDNGKVLISANNGVHLYDYSTNTLEQISTNTSLKPIGYCPIGDGTYLVGTKSGTLIYLYNPTDKSFTSIGSAKAYNNGRFEDFGPYIRISPHQNSNPSAYYVYYLKHSKELVNEEPTVYNLKFVTVTKDIEGNVIEDVGGTIYVNPDALIEGSSVEITSESNTGYYLVGVYTNAELTNLVASLISGDTTISYSEVSSFINLETNTTTLYVVYSEVSEENNPGQTDKEGNGGSDEGVEPGN